MEEEASRVYTRRRCAPAPAHPKYLHWPVAKLESNRFEMTFHLTKHKSGEDRARPRLRSRPPAGLRLTRDNVLPPSPPGLHGSMRRADDFHGPSGDVRRNNVYRGAAVCQRRHRFSYRYCYRALIFQSRANMVEGRGIGRETRVVHLRRCATR